MISIRNSQPERAFLVAVEFRRRSRSERDIELPPSAVMARDVAAENRPHAPSPAHGLEESLAPVFEGRPRDVTEENLQARARGAILMAISNKFGLMVVTTGNKSEMSVGYATLYGDMNGGFNPVKDLYKTEVFRLSRLRNSWKPEDALGPDGVSGHGGCERRVDTAREPEHCAREPALAGVVPRTEHQRAPHLGFGGDVRRRRNR